MARYWCTGPADNSMWIVEDGGRLRCTGDAGRSWGDLARIKGTSAPTTIKRTYGANGVARCALKAGEYHPRVWRAGFCPVPHETHLHEWSQSVHAARGLFDQLAECFLYIEPNRRVTFRTYGHRLRELLILACTEVENACKAILFANDPTLPVSAHLTMRDYAKLVRPLRLSEWEVEILSHPAIPKFRPFAGWRAAKPGKTGASLSWYQAYNATKHSREHAFEQATLERVVHALGAVFVMVLVQFGCFSHRHEQQSGARYAFYTHPEYFHLVNEPAWKPGETYVPPRVAEPALPGWTAVPLKF